MNLPARPSRGLAATIVENMPGGQPPHVSIKGNKFALVDASGQRYPWPHTHLDAIIADANPQQSRLFWGKDREYEGDNGEPPVCWSDNGVGPSRNSVQPQARTCAECPNAAWGSATSKLTGRGVPACRQYWKIAVLVVDDKKIEPIPYLLMVPPASLKNLRTYGSYVNSHPDPSKTRKLDVSDIVTRITFTDNVLGTLEFKPVGYLDAAQETAVDALWKSEVTDDMVGKNDVPWSGGALPAPVAQPQFAPPHLEAKFPPPTNVAAFPPSDPPKSTRGGARPGAGRPPKDKPRTEAPAPKDALAQPSGQMPDMPDFLDRKAQFGLAQPQAPSVELSAAIDAAFKLET